MPSNIISASFVVVGGGISGISCVEQLALELPEVDILLISASSLLKAVTNITKFSRLLEEFEIEEKPFSVLESKYPNVRVIFASVIDLDTANHKVYLSSLQIVEYKKLCLCAGAVPKIIAESNPFVIGIRDTETIQVFQEKLGSARRVIVIGNGGIAIELVHEIENCDIIWAIKDNSIGATFFDPGAAQFFIPYLNTEKSEKNPVLKRTKYTLEEWKQPIEGCSGTALGPDWSSNISMKGKGFKSHNVHVEFCSEVKDILTPEEFQRQLLVETCLSNSSNNESYQWPVYVKLTTGRIFGCDFVISATGIEPNIKPFLKSQEFKIAADGGLSVNDQMQTSINDVYAAGDICTPTWDISKHWFQMRLWTQARQMGAYAGKCMASHWQNETTLLDICFDLFTHVTRFFGYKVILLGLFNGQKLGRDCELLLRMTKGEEFIKVVLQDGRMQGAILIGETDLEETFENLILNQLDLASYGDNLLDPNIDIEDYFD